MAKTRRKSSGCNRGKFKKKPMGKGWLAHRRKPKPPTTKSAEAAAKSEGSDDSAS